MLVLEAKGIVKDFPGVKALQGVDFDLEEGEVHALVGENGAGKSTLVKILTGIHQPDAGTIQIGDKAVPSIPNAAAAFSMGISVIHQELHLMPHLNVATNIFIGRMPSLFGGFGVNWKKTHQETKKALERVSADFSTRAIIKDLSISQQQLVEIAKSVSRNPKIIFMDEPTSSLTPPEIDKLFEVIAELKKQKISVVYISHKLDEIMRASDRITILRDGKKMLTCKSNEITVDRMINVMVGGTLTERYPKEQVPIGEPVLEVKGLNRGHILHDISFNVRRGEILGITGLLGAGRTELVRAIFGADPIDSGEIFIEGKKIHIKNVSDAVDAGIALLTEDRKSQGLMLGLTVTNNIAISSLNCRKVKKDYLRNGFLKWKKINNNSSEYCKMLKIRTPSLQQKVMHLSGGNQQKVIISKWLSTKSRVVIFDEPTRGIDVGTKADIYKIMQGLAREGAAIIMISSELPEALGISDRVLVMRRGRIVAEINPHDTTIDEVIKHSTVAAKNVSEGKPHDLIDDVIKYSATEDENEHGAQ